MEYCLWNIIVIQVNFFNFCFRIAPCHHPLIHMAGLKPEGWRPYSHLQCLMWPGACFIPNLPSSPSRSLLLFDHSGLNYMFFPTTLPRNLSYASSLNLECSSPSLKYNQPLHILLRETPCLPKRSLLCCSQSEHMWLLWPCIHSTT